MADRSTPRVVAENHEPAAHLSAATVAELVAAHHAAVYRYAVRLCGCPFEAEDLTQQAFLTVCRKLDQLREPERAGAWLLTIVRNCFFKSLRKTRSVAAHSAEVEDIPAQVPPLDPFDRELVAAAVAELPAEFRLVLLMFYFEDLSYQQIAEELEIPIGTVMSRLSRAKGQLRRRLAPPTSVQSPPTHVVPAPRADFGNGISKPIGLRAAP